MSSNEFIGLFQVEKDFYWSDGVFKKSNVIYSVFKTKYGSYLIEYPLNDVINFCDQFNGDEFQDFLQHSYKLTEDDLIIKDIIE